MTDNEIKKLIEDAVDQGILRSQASDHMNGTGVQSDSAFLDLVTLLLYALGIFAAFSCS